MRRWFAGLRRRGLAAQSGFLGLIVLALYALVAPVAGYFSGTPGLAAAAAAAGICLLGAASALAACRPLRDPKYALQGLLVGTALRMGLPLAFAIVLQIRATVVAEAGLLCYLIIFYPFTLAAETTLSLPSSKRDQEPPGRIRDAPP
jgi:hypothetical protein